MTNRPDGLVIFLFSATVDEEAILTDVNAISRFCDGQNWEANLHEGMSGQLKIVNHRVLQPLKSSCPLTQEYRDLEEDLNMCDGKKPI